jgi:Protein of unknown function (DUF4242)
MAPEASTEARRAYLVEHYRPGWDVAQLTSCIARVRETVLEMERTGEPVHYVRSTIVPSDESFLCVIEAASEELVGAAYARAGVEFERVTAAISVDG